MIADQEQSQPCGDQRGGGDERGAGKAVCGEPGDGDAEATGDAENHQHRGDGAAADPVADEDGDVGKRGEVADQDEAAGAGNEMTPRALRSQIPAGSSCCVCGVSVCRGRMDQEASAVRTRMTDSPVKTVASRCARRGCRRGQSGESGERGSGQHDL